MFSSVNPAYAAVTPAYAAVTRGDVGSFSPQFVRSGRVPSIPYRHVNIHPHLTSLTSRCIDPYGLNRRELHPVPARELATKIFGKELAVRKTKWRSQLDARQMQSNIPLIKSLFYKVINNEASVTELLDNLNNQPREVLMAVLLILASENNALARGQMAKMSLSHGTDSHTGRVRGDVTDKPRTPRKRRHIEMSSTKSSMPTAGIDISDEIVSTPTPVAAQNLHSVEQARGPKENSTLITRKEADEDVHLPPKEQVDEFKTATREQIMKTLKENPKFDSLFSTITQPEKLEGSLSRT